MTRVAEILKAGTWVRVAELLAAGLQLAEPAEAAGLLPAPLEVALEAAGAAAQRQAAASVAAPALEAHWERHRMFASMRWDHRRRSPVLRAATAAEASLAAGGADSASASRTGS